MRRFWLKPIGYPFVTKPFRKSVWMDWLRKIHAWLGIWGAVACLIFGVSTIALLHPELFPASRPVETLGALPAPEAGIASHDELADYVAGQMGFISAPILGEVRRRGGGMGAATVGDEMPPAMGAGAQAPAMGMGGGRIQRKPTYLATFSTVSRNVTATYVEGNASIEIKTTRRGLLQTMNFLHLGRGADTGWTLLGDIFSASIILMALTGFFLWNVFAGSRLLGVTVFALGLGATWYFSVAGL